MKIATLLLRALCCERERSRFHFSHSQTIIGLHFARNKTTHTHNSPTLLQGKKQLKLQTLHNNLKDDFPKLKTKTKLQIYHPIRLA